MLLGFACRSEEFQLAKPGTKGKVDAYGSKLNRRFESTSPLATVPFWVPSFDPQIVLMCDRCHRLVTRWRVRQLQQLGRGACQRQGGPTKNMI